MPAKEKPKPGGARRKPKPTARTKLKPKPSAKASAEPTSRTCSGCGRTDRCAPGGIPAGWTVSFDRKRVEYLCIDCARANIRAIEGKLPEEYWE